MQYLLAPFSRRNLLRTGLIGGALVGLGSIGLALQKSPPRPDTPKLKVFDPREYAVLVVVAERLCPARGPGAPGAGALGVAATVDEIVADADPETQKGLKIALRIFDNALTGALMGERVTPFTKLTPAEQDAVLKRWRESKLGFRRTVFQALAGTVSSVYWGNDRTWARIGYPGPPEVASFRAAYAENLVELDSLRTTHAAKEI